MFQDGSVSLGSIADIPVRLHVTFPLVLLFSLLSQSPWNLATLAWASLLYGPILLATVLTHELGHSLAARRAGSEAHGILLWPLGGLAFVGHSASPKVDLFVAIMGPLTHLPQFLLWFVLLLAVSYAAYGRLVFPGPFSIPSPQDHFWVALLVGACWLNVMLAAFNLLLPAYPLDGGRILAGSLLLLGVGEQLAARIVAGLAVVVGLGVLALGAWQFSLITIMVGLWMLYTTSSLVKAIKDDTVEQHPLFAYEESTVGVTNQATKAGYQPYTGQASV